MKVIFSFWFSMLFYDTGYAVPDVSKVIAVTVGDCSPILQNLQAMTISLNLICDRNGEPVPEALTDNYIRLAGAVEVPILIQLQSVGGIGTCDSDACSIGRQGIHTVSNFDVQTGDISRSLGEYWRRSWPFRDSLPIATPLWREVASDGMRGIAYLDQVEFGLGTCVDKLLRPWEHESGGYERYFPGKCSRNSTKRVGFLLWEFKNSSSRILKNLQILFSSYPASLPSERYVSELTSKHVRLRRPIVVPQLESKQSALVLLSVYERANTGFEKRFISQVMIPRLIEYEVDGKRFVHPVRPPLREKAATVYLPFGWYLQ